MACNLTRGRLVDCKDVIGGIKTVYFTEIIVQIAELKLLLEVVQLQIQ